MDGSVLCDLAAIASFQGLFPWLQRTGGMELNKMTCKAPFRSLHFIIVHKPQEKSGPSVTLQQVCGRAGFMAEFRRYNLTPVQCAEVLRRKDGRREAQGVRTCNNQRLG